MEDEGFLLAILRLQEERYLLVVPEYGLSEFSKESFSLRRTTKRLCLKNN